MAGVRTEPRPLGGTPIELSPAFFEPLPEDVTDGFDGDRVSRASQVAEGPCVPTLSARARALFQSPENEVYLSAASTWEIATKHALGRLSLPAPVEQLIPALREKYGVVSLPIDEESTLHLARLPALHHDPFDRIVVSQAIVHGMAVLTPDRLIAQYPARVVW